MRKPALGLAGFFVLACFVPTPFKSGILPHFGPGNFDWRTGRRFSYGSAHANKLFEKELGVRSRLPASLRKTGSHSRSLNFKKTAPPISRPA